MGRAFQRNSEQTTTEVQDPNTELDVSIAPPEKDEIMATIRSLKKNEKPQGRTVSTQSPSLQHKFSSRYLQKYRRRNNNLTTGQRVSS